jgi:hypothetical protein
MMHSVKTSFPGESPAPALSHACFARPVFGPNANEHIAGGTDAGIAAITDANERALG